MIGSYPEVLVVRDVRRLILVLSTDKSAQVVMAGVYKMSENFLFTPFMRIGLGQKIMIGDSLESFRKIMNDLQQFECYNFQESIRRPGAV